MVSPLQILDADQVISGDSGFFVTFTVTLFDRSLIHPPCNNLQTAVYSVELLGDTLIDELVRLLDQTVAPSQPVAVKLTASPSQIVCLFEVIVGLFGLLIVTFTSFDLPLSQLLVLQEAEKVVVDATETVMLEPVEALDQTIVPVQPAADSVI